MCKLKHFVASLLLVNIAFLSQAEQLSSTSRISLLTCSAGDELYTCFGHSALRVCDDSLGIDLVFNYGTFDFQTPNFYMKFVNGELDYMLSASDFMRFTRVYNRENREVVEHELDFSLSERQRAWELLCENYLPENRFYRYDFFFDNCATRIRDLVFTAKDLSASDFRRPLDVSFRDCLHECIDRKSLATQGIDIVLGVRTDKNVDVYSRAFLPIYLDYLFTEAGLIAKSSVIVERLTTKSNESVSIADWFTVDNVLWCLIAVALTVTCLVVCLLERINWRYYMVFDCILFGIVGLFSLFLWYTSCITHHAAMRYNPDLLWASIFHLPMLIFFVRGKKKIANSLFLFNIWCLFTFICLAFMLDYAYISCVIAAILMLRNLLIFRRFSCGKRR